MRDIITVFCALLFVSHAGFSQDEIILSNGDIIKAKVSEVGVSEIKYKKWDNLEGPIYSTIKEEVFMIKYENGSKDVFSNSTQSQLSNVLADQPAVNTGAPATIYFIRPKKMAARIPDIIVGTAVPDEVITKVSNGRWHKTTYTNFGEIEFVAGIYTINPEVFRYNIEQGKTYFIFCTVLNKGFKVMAELQLLDENAAQREMSGLKEQLKAK